MPCRTDGYPTAEETLRCERDDLKDRCDMLTRMLCGVMQEFEEQAGTGELFESEAVGDSTRTEILTWWENHKVSDRKRKEAEARLAKEQRETDERIASLMKKSLKSLRPDELAFLKKHGKL